ncbi:SRPBCC family protein [Rhodococcus sp. LB1]|uniref:SRPBCC family protein n=1 Tax=Rhodococcus sp. LB1 TaxID=1807499 RepID=UPI0007C836C1|nr:SRPBCC family protein [Rhodococcus sp. LB1]
MKFTNQFVVPEPIDAAWKLLADVPRIAPCLPGASVSQLSDDEYEGSIAVKVGPIKVGYTGIAKFLELDEHNHTMLLDGRGNESSGKGSAAAQIRVNLTDTGSGSTVVDVTTDLQVTGKVAQFGRSAMADIGERLIAQFAANLEAMIAGPGAETPKAQRSGTAAATAHTPTVGSAPSAAGSELNAFALAAPLLKRAAPVAAALAVGFIVGRWLSPRRAARPSAEAVPFGNYPWFELALLQQFARDDLR